MTYKQKIYLYYLLYLLTYLPLQVSIIPSCEFELLSGVLSFPLEGLPLVFVIGQVS